MSKPFNESAHRMSIAAILDNLRKDYPGCHYVAYTDLNAGMVLATSANHPMTQEYWDGLSETAVDMLHGDVAHRVGQALAIKAENSIYHAILSDGPDLGVFVRSVSNPGDALCCVCAPSVPLSNVIDRMQKCLAEIDHDT